MNEDQKRHRKKWPPARLDVVGLKCSNCECQDFFVVYTQAVKGARIRRRRECRHCGKRVTTYESA